MDLFTTILWFIVAIVVLVGIHEYGHFLAARLFGVRVLRFCIGLGKPIWSWYDKQGTEFCIAPFPLGGYVKLLDAREGEVPEADKPFEFTSKPVWQRIVVYFAGPLANFILAFLLFWVLFLQARVDFPPIVGAIAPDSIAEQAGLVVGQRIVAVDDKATPTQQAVARQLLNRLGETGPISFDVRYPESDLVYTSGAYLDEWLRGVEGPDPVGGLGITFKGLPRVVVGVTRDGPAAEAGFQEGDRIVEADGQALADWESWANHVAASAGQEIQVVVEREGQRKTLYVTPRQASDEAGKPVYRVGLTAGVDSSQFVWYHYTWPEAMVEAGKETLDGSLLVFTSVEKLLTSEISSKNLSGIITIAKVAGSSAERGWQTFFGFLALLSVNLGVLNLLPIPILDGGQIMFLIMEAIKGGPVSEKVQIVSYQIGLFLVASLMIFALYNDVLRL